MPNRIRHALSLSVLAAIPLAAQTQDPSGFAIGRGLPTGAAIGAPPHRSSQHPGFEISHVSGFGGLSHVDAGGKIGSESQSTTGGMIGVGAYVPGAKASFETYYTGSYFAYPGEFDRNRWGHILGASFQAKLTPRLTFTIGVNAGVYNFDQFFFNQPVFTRIAQAGSIEDLLTAAAGGNVTNSQLAAMLTGAPVLESPAASLLFGSRIFTAGGQAKLGYSIGPRTNLNFQGAWVQSQSLKDDSTEGTNSIAFLSRARNNTGAVTLSHMLNPTTFLALSAGSQRVQSQVSDIVSVNGTATIGKLLGTKWFVEGGGGSGNVYYLRGTSSAVGKRFNLQGNATYRLSQTQAFTVMAMRNFVDDTGLGSSAVLHTGVSWSYGSVSRGWGVDTSWLYQRLSNTVRPVDGQVARAMLSKNVGRHFGVAVQAFYTKSNSPHTTNFVGNEFIRTGVRGIVSWFPMASEAN